MRWGPKVSRMLKYSDVIPRSASDEESAFHNLLILHDSRFLARQVMTPEMVVAADFHPPASEQEQPS